ncbi:hypothetical protein FOZ62_031950, partial [Perkinsus olseni]
MESTAICHASCASIKPRSASLLPDYGFRKTAWLVVRRFEAFFLDYPTQESVDPDVFTAVWPAVMDDIEDLWEEYAGKGHGAPRQSPPRKAGSTAEVLKSSCAGLSVEKRGTDRRRMLSAARETKRRLQGFERVSKKKD